MKTLLAILIGLGNLTSAQNHPELRGILGVANKQSGTATFFDLHKKSSQTVKVGYLPHEVALSKRYAYVSNYGSAYIRSSKLSDVPGNTITAIDLENVKNSKEISLGAHRCAPHGLAISKDGQRLFVTCEIRHEILVINTETQSVEFSIPTNQAGSHLVVLSPDETRAYVANFWHGTVSVLDIEKKEILQQINTGRGTEGIEISPDGKFLFLTSVETGEVMKVSTENSAVLQRKKIGQSPIRALARGEFLLVNDAGAGVLWVLKSENLEVVRKIPVGQQNIGLAASESHVFIANMKDATISVINLKTWKVEDELKTDLEPDGLAFVE